MASVRISCCAKINYTLDVLSRRGDGYHNLASVMQTVSLADVLTVTESETPGITLECRAPGVPHDARNLAWRAASAIVERYAPGAGVSLRLEKRIPSEAGLGGGSSDAAAAIRAVDALLELGLPSDALLETAASLGSDVPFFLTGGTAAVRSRGELVRSLPDGPLVHLVIVKPEVGVSTAAAYAALDGMSGRVSARATGRMEAALATGSWQDVVRGMLNDFEQVVLDQAPQVASLMDDLRMAGAGQARLSGSGSACFGVVEDEASAARVARLLRLRYPDVWVARSVGRDESMQVVREVGV